MTCARQWHCSSVRDKKSISHSDGSECTWSLWMTQELSTKPLLMSGLNFQWQERLCVISHLKIHRQDLFTSMYQETFPCNASPQNNVMTKEMFYEK